jgi:hypothetical protein
MFSLDDGMGFMAGETEVDEPFVEQAPSHVLQKRDTPPIHPY